MPDTCDAPIELAGYGMLCGAPIPRDNCPGDHPLCPYQTDAQREKCGVGSRAEYPTPATESDNIGTSPSETVSHLVKLIGQHGYAVVQQSSTHGKRGEVVMLIRHEMFPVVDGDQIDALQRALNWAQTGGDE